MTDDDDVLAALNEARAILSWAHERLVTSNSPLQQLGEYFAPHRVLGVTRRGRMVKIGQVWRLGVFLVGSDGTLFSAGDTVRSEGSAITSHNSAYRAERGEYAHAAFRAGYVPGTIVNFGASPISLEAGSLATPTSPLFVRGRNTFVRWHSGVVDDQAVLFSEYMVERIGLLLNPPVGSTG